MSDLIVPTMAEMLAKENNLKYYFGWVVQVVLMIEQKNNKSICTNFESCNVPFAVLGTEESYR
jgi:hypothetical protein